MIERPAIQLSAGQGRRIWLHAQGLDTSAPFGSGAKATPAAVAHLGYLQIDTIYVIERSHHHILYTRIPTYRREHLHQAHCIDKTVFEYWTHALSYVPTESLRFYVRQMRRDWQRRVVWFDKVSNEDLRRVVSRIRRDGAVTIRDIDDAAVDKDYAWGSRKPSKRILEAAFYKGLVTISQRTGMVKTYELTTRHFGWERLPRAASEKEILNYVLDRALRSQGNRECGVNLLFGECYTEVGDEAAGGVASAGEGPGTCAGGRGGGVGALGASGDAGYDSRGGRGAGAYPVTVRSAGHSTEAS